MNIIFTIFIFSAIFLLFVIVVFGIGFFQSEIEKEQTFIHFKSPSIAPLAGPVPSLLFTDLNKEEPVFIDNNVPFTAQAPLAQWSDPVFKDGCEEASVLMAVYWAQGKKIGSPEEASFLIKKLSDWQQEHDGEFRDRSIIDVADLIRDYFQYNDIELKKDISLYDIREYLSSRAVIIVPVAGRQLHNPHFTAPGPLNHMLVIRGYDPHTREFITNEPGTRHGEGYRYPEDVLYNAIRDYPTGYQEPIVSIQKHMIVVGSYN